MRPSHRPCQLALAGVVASARVGHQQPPPALQACLHGASWPPSAWCVVSYQVVWAGQEQPQLQLQLPYRPDGFVSRQHAAQAAPGHHTHVSTARCARNIRWRARCDLAARGAASTYVRGSWCRAPRGGPIVGQMRVVVRIEMYRVEPIAALPVWTHRQTITRHGRGSVEKRCANDVSHHGTHGCKLWNAAAEQAPCMFAFVQE